MALARVGNQDLKVLVLVQYLFNTAIVPALFLRPSLLHIVFIFVT